MSALFIVKRRTLETHPRGTISAVRVVRKFSRWRRVHAVSTASEACRWIEEWIADEHEDPRARGHQEEFAIFHRGQKIRRYQFVDGEGLRVVWSAWSDLNYLKESADATTEAQSARADR